MLNESSSESALFLRLALTDLLSEGVFCLDVLLCFRQCEVTDCRRAETPAMATFVGMMEAGRPRLLVSALRDCVTMTGVCQCQNPVYGEHSTQNTVQGGMGHNCINKVHPPSWSHATLGSLSQIFLKTMEKK